MVLYRFTHKNRAATLLDSLLHEKSQFSIVVFVSLPISFASLDSPLFRQLLLYFQKMKSTSPSLLFHLIPDYLTIYALRYPKSHHMGLDQVACSVYDRLLRSVKRPTKSRFASLTAFRDPRGYFQAPAYTLVGPD